MVDANGDGLTQRNYIVQVNRAAHGREIHSDLAGFTWPCEDEECKPKICKEPLVLPDPEDPSQTYPNVHHVVPKKDRRNCWWGTNSNKNAAVISAGLNNYFLNHNPPAEEVKILNSTKAYTP